MNQESIICGIPSSICEAIRVMNETSDKILLFINDEKNL